MYDIKISVFSMNPHKLQITQNQLIIQNAVISVFLYIKPKHTGTLHNSFRHVMQLILLQSTEFMLALMFNKVRHLWGHMIYGKILLFDFQFPNKKTQPPQSLKHHWHTDVIRIGNIKPSNFRKKIEGMDLNM